jgi:hypothetical protein
MEKDEFLRLVWTWLIVRNNWRSFEKDRRAFDRSHKIREMFDAWNNNMKDHPWMVDLSGKAYDGID